MKKIFLLICVAVATLFVVVIMIRARGNNPTTNPTPVVANQSQINLAAKENWQEGLHVAVLTQEVSDIVLESYRGGLPSSNYILRVRATGEISLIKDRILHQHVEVLEVYRGGVEVGEEIEITHHSWVKMVLENDNNDYQLPIAEVGFINFMVEDDEYLIFLDSEQAQLSSNGNKVYEFFSGYFTAPIFNYEDKEHVFPTLSSEGHTYVPLEKVSGNEFFVENEEVLEDWMNFKHKLLEIFPRNLMKRDGQTTILTENWQSYFKVPLLTPEISDNIIRRFREELPSSNYILRVRATGELNFIYNYFQQHVEVLEVYRGEGIAEGEEIEIMDSRWDMSVGVDFINSGVGRVANIGFINFMVEGDEYLIFLDSKLKEPSSKGNKVYQFGEYLTAPIFNYEDKEHVFPPLTSEDERFVPLEKVWGNEFFVESEEMLGEWTSFKHELLEMFPGD